MTTKHILIADDHPIFLKGLQDVIESDANLNVRAQAKDGQEALKSLQNSSFDVAILDLNMPRLTGLEVAEQILQTHPHLPLILLTMHKEEAHFIKALEVGIMGYVLKENAVTDVIQAIHQVLEGGAYISPEMSAFLLKKKGTMVHKKEPTNIQLLTPAERQILSLIAQFKSSKEMADMLFISERTVNNHRMNIARKLNLSGKNSLLRFAMENS